MLLILHISYGSAPCTHTPRVAHDFLSWLCSGAYAKGLLAQGIQVLPQGYTQTSPGTVTGEQEEQKSGSGQSEGLKLEKSNIILLGPTGCG